MEPAVAKRGHDARLRAGRLQRARVEYFEAGRVTDQQAHLMEEHGLHRGLALTWLARQFIAPDRVRAG